VAQCTIGLMVRPETTLPLPATAVLAGNPVLAGFWYPVARSTDVAPGPVGVRLLGGDYVVYRGDGGLAAALDRCPHREAPLSLGRVADGCVQCPYHGWSFDSAGTCTRVPSAEPGTPIPPKARLTTVHVAERYGLVWLCTGEPTTGIPDIGEDDDPAFRRINSPVEIWRTSSTRLADNFMDFSHFPWVHTGTFGLAQEQLIPTLELEALDEQFYGYRYGVTVSNPLSATVTSGQTAAVLQRKMTTGFNLPFNVRSTILYETGLQHILLLLTTPIDDVHCYFTFVVWRNDDFSVSAEDVIQFDRRIGAEDKVMLESMPGVLPLDNRATVSVQADRGSVEWRRRFKALLDSV
jgi:phenylpropionate dioxygenase-like ring-hydroxylating dioxygenase large terminal subunit